ncbi:protein-serine/threonine phosphatase [Enterobacterales bacterium CwR94]|nr:protein-serine/threonine phosphatase [Enterobacterales bacterium CwR94]
MNLPSQLFGDPTTDGRKLTARDLAHQVPWVTPDTDNLDVVTLFNEHKNLVSLPVVEQGRPFGLINRQLFLSQMTRPFFRELYDRKSCIAFMDKTPLVIEANSTLEQVADQVVACGDKTITDGFILAEEGHYLGLGLGMDLIKTVSQVQAQQHQQIMQSIEYARVIQEAMLDKSRSAMDMRLQDWCLSWQPRDCVGGDYYVFLPQPQGFFMMLADCTGHGVPGAFMTVILAGALEKAFQHASLQAPERVLQHVNLAIKETLGQFNQQTRFALSNDGCDAFAAWIDTAEHRLCWAGARSAAFLVRPDAEPESLVCDKMGVGYTDTPVDYVWTRHEITFEPQDMLFTVTDGVTDQPGGERGIMFGKRRIRELLDVHRQSSMNEVSQALMHASEQWQGSEHRRDDVTWFGFRYGTAIVSSEHRNDQ